MNRPYYLEQIQRQLRIQPICAILGARQVGKTTLARQFASTYPQKTVIFDLENPSELKSLEENPFITLGAYHDHLIIIDEIQRRPDLFPILRVLVDDPVKKYTFLILGSASRDLIRQSSETLAGRIGYIELPSFTLFEVESAEKLLIRGGFPPSYLAQSDDDSFLWRENYITTFLERDLPSFGFDVPAPLMHRFWMMLCFYHGQTLNSSEMARSLMLSDKTITKYVDILAGTFMIRVLQPWLENIKKRQTKTPKIYFRDSGIYNTLTSTRLLTDIIKTPKVGALWEGFVLEQIINCFQIRSNECYFWSTSNEAELDLLAFKGGKKIGFEIKYSENPTVTKSMNIAVNDLKLDHLYLIFPGKIKFPLNDKMTACGLDSLRLIAEKF